MIKRAVIMTAAVIAALPLIWLLVAVLRNIFITALFVFAAATAAETLVIIKANKGITKRLCPAHFGFVIKPLKAVLICTIIGAAFFTIVFTASEPLIAVCSCIMKGFECKDSYLHYDFPLFTIKMADFFGWRYILVMAVKVLIEFLFFFKNANKKPRLLFTLITANLLFYTVVFIQMGLHSLAYTIVHQI